MEKKWKIQHIVVSIFLAAAVVLCITVVAQTLSRGYVTIFNTSLFRVVTGSMEPTIPTGSLLVTKTVEIEEIEEGDIICFRSKSSGMLGQVITHRVVDIQTGEDGLLYLETRGDANPSSDGYYVTEQNLIGRVSNFTRDGNPVASVFSLITSKIGFFTCIVFPVLIIAALIMKDSMKSIRRELYEIHKEMENETEKTSIEDVYSPEEYEELVARLRREILEEVKNSVEETGKETGDGADGSSGPGCIS